MAGKAWTEQHIKELIKASIIKNGSSGGSSDNPDDSNVYSSYNYPILLENGMNSGRLYFFKNNTLDTSWNNYVYFGRPSSVAAQFEKISQNRPDFAFVSFKQNILPVGGSSSSAANVAYISKLKTPITGGPATPAGTKGLFGVITGSPQAGTGGSRYLFVSFPGNLRDLETDLTAFYEHLNDNYAGSTGNYYFLSPDIITSRRGYIDLYIKLNTGKIVIVRNGIYDMFGEPFPISFHSINIYNPVYMYHLTGLSTISTSVNAIKQFFEDNDLTFEYFNLMVTTAQFTAADIAAATTYRTYELSLL